MLTPKFDEEIAYTPSSIYFEADYSYTFSRDGYDPYETNGYAWFSYYANEYEKKASISGSITTLATKVESYGVNEISEIHFPLHMYNFNGTLVLIDIPDDWYSVDEDGAQFIAVDFGDVNDDGLPYYERIYVQPKEGQDSEGETFYRTSSSYILTEDNKHKRSASSILQSYEEEKYLAGEMNYLWYSYSDNDRLTTLLFTSETD